MLYKLYKIQVKRYIRFLSILGKNEIHLPDFQGKRYTSYHHHYLITDQHND